MAYLRALCRRIRRYELTDNAVICICWISAGIVFLVSILLGLPE